MAIYLVQHGLSLPKDVDPERSLSVDGREETIRVATYLQKLGVSLKAVCHSGKTRAQQTAEIFANELGVNDPVELPGMAPNDDVADFAETLSGDDTMYVGHLPHMGKLASYLITGNENSAVVAFANSGVVCLDHDSTGCHIKWFITPATCG
jgi:phosphohistidine phosphatase